MTLRLAWAGIVVLATYLTFIGGAWLGIYSAPLRILTLLAAGALLVAWLAAGFRSEQWRPRSVLWPAIVAALGSLAISTVFSRVPRMSFEYLGYAVVLAALYLLLVRLMAHPFFQRRLLTLAAMFFGVVSIAFLGLVVKHWIDWWALIGHLAVPPLRPNFEGLTYNNPSAVLTIAVLFAVPAIALIDPATRRGKAAIGVILVVLGGVAFLTGSRAGWLAIALTMVVGAVVAGLDPGVRTTARRTISAILRDRRSTAVGAFVVVAGIVALVVFTPAIIRRVSEGGEDLRAQYAVTALRIFASSPVVGTGPGSWVVQRMAETADNEPDYVIPHAHNLEVQTLAEQGVIGAAAGIVVVVALALLVLRATRDADPMRRRMGWLALLGLVYFGAHQLLDFYANLPAVLFAAVVPVAYLDATSPPRPAGRPARLPNTWINGRAPATVLGVGALAVIAALLLAEIPALRNERAVQLANDGHWADAAAPARDAAAADPAIGSYALTAGLTAARAGDNAAALDLFRQVADQDDLPEAWIDLAAEQLALGRDADARASLDRAFRLGRQRTGTSLAIADLALRAGYQELAATAASVVLQQQPLLAADAWWSATPERAALLNGVSSGLARQAADSVKWQLAMASGDAATARAVTANLADEAFYGQVIDAWSGNEAVIEPFRATCYASAGDVDRLIWCAKVASHTHGTWGEDMRTLLDSLGSGASNLGGIALITDAPTEFDVLTGGTIAYWGVFTYRRPVPGDMIVPGVAHLVLR